MARLSLGINIADQKLLARNKERAAANQKALEERKRLKAEAEERVDDTAPTEETEYKGATPAEFAERRPAATRRDKKWEVFSLENLGAYAVSGTLEEVSESFLAYGANWRYPGDTQDNTRKTGSTTSVSYYNTAAFGLVNSYSLQDTYFLPVFQKELRGFRDGSTADFIYFRGTINSFDWYFTQRSQQNGVLGATAVTGSPPSLPFDITEKVVLDVYPVESSNNGYEFDNGTSLTTSDGRYIYHSKLVAVMTAGDNITQGADTGDSVYDTDNFEVDYISRDIDGTNYRYEYTRRTATQHVDGLGRVFSWSRGSTPITPAPTDTYISVEFTGLYWRYDTRLKTVAYKETSVTYADPSRSDGYAAAAAWLDGMYDTDPAKEMYLSYTSSLSSLSDSLKAQAYFSDSTSYLTKWPKGLVYQKGKKRLTIVFKPWGADWPRLYYKDIGTSTATYFDVLQSIANVDFTSAATTESELLQDYWLLAGEIPRNTVGELDYYFGIFK